MRLRFAGLSVYDVSQTLQTDLDHKGETSCCQNSAVLNRILKSTGAAGDYTHEVRGSSAASAATRFETKFVVEVAGCLFVSREPFTNSLEKDADMPFIQVKAIEGVFSPEQKQEIVEKLTDTILAIGSEAMRPYTTVLIEEIASGSWAQGGTAFTTAGVKALASGAK